MIDLEAQYRTAMANYFAAQHELIQLLVPKTFAALDAVLPGSKALEVLGEMNEDWNLTLRIQRILDADDVVLFDIAEGSEDRTVEDTIDEVNMEFLDMLIDLTGDDHMGIHTIERDEAGPVPLEDDRFSVSYNADSETETDVDPWEVLVMDGRGVQACVETASDRGAAEALVANPTAHMLRMADEYEALKPLNETPEERLRSILIRKALGTDCTEDESAAIKGYLRTHNPDGNEDHPHGDLLAQQLVEAFPLEWNESQDETRTSDPAEAAAAAALAAIDAVTIADRKRLAQLAGPAEIQAVIVIATPPYLDRDQAERLITQALRLTFDGSGSVGKLATVDFPKEHA